MQQPKKPSSGLNPKDHELLISELTKYAEEGASDEDLKIFKDTFIAQKKKATPNVTESPSANGSLDSSKIDFKLPKVDSFKTKTVKQTDPVAKTVAESTSAPLDRRVTTDIVELKENDKMYAEIRDKEVQNYQTNTQLSEEEIAESQQELIDAKEKNGVWNTVKSITAGVVNPLYRMVTDWKDDGIKPELISTDPLEEEKKKAAEMLKAKGEKPTPESIGKLADELYVKKSIENKKQAKINDYLQSIDPQVKTTLEVDAQDKYQTLEKRSKELTDRIKLNEHTGSQLLEQLNDPNLTEQDRNMIMDSVQKIGSEMDKDFNDYQSNYEKLGSAAEELDAFKRNYGAIENFGAKALNSIASTAVDLYTGSTYLANTYLGSEDNGRQQAIQEARKGLEEHRGRYRKELDELTLDNFGQYAMDLLANQSGTLLTMASPAGAYFKAGTLGVGQAGQTYSEMYQENKKSAKYTPLQMAIAPLLSGTSTALFSELPTIKTLRGSKRVFEAAFKDEIGKEGIKSAFRETAKRLSNDLGREVSTELIDNTLQNVIKRDVLGDEKVNYFDGSWKVIKDTALLTGMISAPSGLAHVGMAGIKMMSNTEQNLILDSNGKKIIELSKQLDNDLDDDTRSIIESQISKLTKDSQKIVDETVKRIDGMPEEAVKSVINSEKKITDIEAKAATIKESESLDKQAKQIALDALKSEYESANNNIEEKLNAVYPKQSKSEVNEENAIVEQVEKTQPQTQEQEEIVEVRLEPKTILQLSEENKSTLPKVPVKNVFLNDTESLSREQTKGVDYVIENAQESSLPVESIGISNIVPTQKNLTIDNLQNTGRVTESAEPIILNKIGDKYYVVDGHHRIANEILKGNSNIEARVFKNEETPANDIAPDGNVQPRIGEQTTEGRIYDVQPEPDDRGREKGGKSRKKALLNRAFTGINTAEVKSAIEKHGLNYEIENQEQAKSSAKNFINEVGVNFALDAARTGKIKGAEKAFVYAEAIEMLNQEIESVDNYEDKEELQEFLNNLIGSLNSEFDQEGREAGRFISALNRVYLGSGGFYNLEKQINDYKALNNGVIPDDVRQKFIEAHNKIKELEVKIKEAEDKLELAESQKAVASIQEDIARKEKKVTSPSRKAKDLATKIREAKIHRPDIFSSATPATLVWDGAIEVIAKTVEAGGTFAEAVQKGIDFIQKSKWYKGLTENQQAEAKNALRDYMRESTKEPFVRIDENGKITVPERMIRDLVKSGITEIDELSQAILDTIKDEHPEVTLREIRDSITRYGKTVNPSQDEIDTQIRKMKRVGKLISGLEDANKGQRPKRSGLQRDKIGQNERAMKRELTDLLRDIPMDDADLSKKWKTALDGVKSRLRNSIEDLEKQIVNKEKSKPEKNPVEYDQEAKDLKQRRDELKATLEEIVGKPELTEEQKIQRAINAVESSIDKLRTQIADNDLAYKKKPSKVTSAKLEDLRSEQKALRETLDGMRQDAGIAEARRLELAKNAAKRYIETYQRRLAEKDFAKKEVKQLIPDDELTRLKSEMIKAREVFDKARYVQELNNRSRWKKIADGVLDALQIPRILKATAELSFVGVQGGILTVSRKFTNPIEFARIMNKLFKSIGSDKIANEYESIIKAHPLYELSKKSKLALTNPDFKTEAKEENFTGDYANLIWDLPILMRGEKKASEMVEPYSSQFKNKVREIFGKEKIDYEKVTREQRHKNINPFIAIERGASLYLNTLRFEEFVIGCRMLEAEGKNPIDNPTDYKMLANSINTMSGRANIGNLSTHSKALSFVFFSIRNAIATFNQLNPLYYAYLHTNGFKQLDFKKTSVANKLAMYNMIKFWTITGTTMLLLKAMAGQDDEGKDKIEIETDPRSSDFMKMKLGNTRFDPFHGQTTQATFWARFISEETKNLKTGRVKKLGESFGGSRNRADLVSNFVTNKFSPTMGIAYKYASTHLNKKGERVTNYGTPYGQNDESLNMMPMYWASVQEIAQEDPDALTNFLTVVSFFGLNTSTYGDKKKDEKK